MSNEPSIRRFWCSFVEPKPTPTFLGVSIIDAHDVAEVVFIAHMAGLNPGGEVQMVEATGPAFHMLAKHAGRFFPPAEALALRDELDAHAGADPDPKQDHEGQP